MWHKTDLKKIFYAKLIFLFSCDPMVFYLAYDLFNTNTKLAKNNYKNIS